MEKILTNLVLLRSSPSDLALAPAVSPEALNAIANQLRRPQLRDQGTMAPGQPIRLIGVRDQLSVELQDRRIAIEDESDHLPYSPRFWDLVHHVVVTLQADFRPFGFNFEVAMDHPDMTSGALLSRTLGAARLSSLAARPVSVGSSTVQIPSVTSTDLPYTWTFTIEPRFDDPYAEKTYVKGNAHFDMSFALELANSASIDIFAEFSSITHKILELGEGE